MSLAVILDPDSKPKACHACAPAVACASAIGREAGFSVSSARWFAIVCRPGSLASSFRFKTSLQGACVRVALR